MQINNMCIFDLDGTMDLTDAKLTAKILRMSRNGTAFVTATGRTNSYVRATCKKYNIIPPRFIIADNGGTVYDNSERKYIMKTALPLEKREAILREFVKRGGMLEDIRYTDGDNVYASNVEDVREYYKDESIIEYRQSEELAEAILREESDITKITLAGNKRLMKEIIKFLQKEDIKCWTDIGATKFPHRARQNYRLDITDGETSKGKAVEFLSSYLGVKWFTCIGNGPNDFSMFKYALDTGMPIVVVKNFEEGVITKESEDVVYQVQEYARKIGRENQVTIASYPINGYMDKIEERQNAKYRRQSFVQGFKVEETPRIDTSKHIVKKAIRRTQEK